ncbi:MAG TPA: ABC transporter substrate-binding protein [Spirochaetota bacterium]|nr:ABC transporter substrate-binding protein [Spirochaetota bacterium]HOL57948.1 ABC transporter substrate-binding protein [Spirochaetota bacterium]HPP05496.1 ABC transporter substrate-binding protein [Spirochaetota bacterium]
MKRTFLLCSLILLLLTGCKDNKNVIKIGFIGPLTGDYANYGIMMSNAAKLAIEEKNSKGGIDGKKIVLIAEDSEGKVEKANSAIEKLASVDKIFALIGGVFSGESLAIAPRAEAEKIVMCSPSATHKALTSKGNFIFRNVLSDELQAIIFAKYARNIMKLNKIAILYIKNDYSQGLAEDFQANFEKEGGKIVAMETGVAGDKDFKTQLTKIKDSKAEALYIPNYVAEMAQILEQKNQLGLDLKVLSADGFSNPEIFDLAKDNAVGVLFSNSAEDTSNNTLKIEFINKYKTKYKVEPDNFSLNAYDIANLFVNAIETVYNESSKEDKEKLNLNRERIREVFHSTKDYAGVSGTINFLANGDASKNVGIYISEKGEDGKYSYKQIAVYKLNDKNKLEEVK